MILDLEFSVADIGVVHLCHVTQHNFYKKKKVIVKKRKRNKSLISPKALTE